MILDDFQARCATWSLDVGRLRQVLDYDPETGVFRWRERLMVRNRIGDVAGTIRKDGRREIGINRRTYLAHRLAWLHVHGVWPDSDIDHRNGIPDDNRIANLRLATRAQNLQNLQHVRSTNTSGYTGVQRQKNKWRADISLNRQHHFLGLFDTAEEASAAYRRAKAEMHPFWEAS